MPRGALVSLLAGAEHTRLTMLSAPAGLGEDDAAAAMAPGGGRPALRMAVAGAQRRRPGALLDLRHRGAAHGRAGRRRSRGGRAALARHEPRGGRRAPARQRARSSCPDASSSSSTTCTAVADEEIHRSLVAFVERLPATVHLAVATRADPPWPMLPRLRARDQLVELRSGQMRFSEAEAGSYLAALGLELTGRPSRRDPAAHRGLGGGRAARRAVAARLPRERGLRRRAGRRQPGDRRLPGRGGPRSRGTAGAALPAADLDPRPHVRGPLRRRDRRRRVRRPARRPRPPQPVRRRPGQPPALVPLPPAVRASCCAHGWTPRSPARRSSCTVARPHGSPATARSPRPSATRSPPATSTPRPISSRATG